MNGTTKKSMVSKRQWRIFKENLTGWSFLSPYIIIFSIFFIVPFFYGIYITFFDWNLFQPEQTTFVEFRNYYNVLFNTESIYYVYFWEGLTNTLTFVVISVPFLIIIPLLISILIETRPFGQQFFRTILFLPTVLSISAVVLIWRWQLNTNGGFINSVLLELGFDEIPFLQQNPWAWISILMVTVWWTMGINMVIFGAGIKNIDKTLYEAASIDGASKIQTFFYITLPQLAPQMIVVTIMTLLASFNIYGQPEMLTNGGPNKETTVLMMYIRQFATGSNARPGVATTMALLLGLIMITISIIQSRIIKGRGN